MSSFAVLTAWLSLAGWLLYIALPVQLLPLLEESRPEVKAVQLRGQTLGEPGLVTLEAHVDFGVRASSIEGGRWLLQRGRVTVGGTGGSGRWVPELEILLLHTPDQFLNWFATRDVDFDRNDLARIEDRDCFVIGGRDGVAQLWLDKQTLEVVRFVSSSGVQVDYRAYARSGAGATRCCFRSRASRARTSWGHGIFRAIGSPAASRREPSSGAARCDDECRSGWRWPLLV